MSASFEIILSRLIIKKEKYDIMSCSIIYYLSCSLSTTFILLSLASITAVIAIYATCATSHIISTASISPPLPLTGLPGNRVITYSIMRNNPKIVIVLIIYRKQ